MWTTWPLPRNEGTRMHPFGNATVCVAIDTAGEGDILAAMALYGPAARETATASRGRRATRGRRGEGGRAIALPPLSDPAWSRFFMGKWESYELAPGYPSIPVCVRLNESFSLSPGASTDGWIFSTLEARVLVGGALMASFPLRKPYKTLYGLPETGVVCRYDEADFLSSGESVMETLSDDPALVAHPVRLRNTSQAPVTVTDLCIYGEQLSIFAQGRRQLSEPIQFTYSSSGVRMSLDGRGAPPAGATVVARPRVHGEDRFIERSFELFKAMTGL